MSLRSILDTCRDLAWDPHLASVAAWKAEEPDRRTVGCFPVYVPAEVIHAAGMLPVGLYGGFDPGAPPNGDPRLSSLPCSICRSTLAQASEGKLACLNEVVFTSICTGALSLSDILARDFRDIDVTYLELPREAGSPAAVDQWERELRRLAEGLARRHGARVEDYRLRSSLGLYNLWRRRVRDLYTQRLKWPHKISAEEVYTLVRAGTRLLPETHIFMLEEALREIPRRKRAARERLSLVLEGAVCEQPPPGLLDSLERAGCCIVDEDLLLGWRWFYEDIPDNGNPWRSLAESYLERSVPSSVRYPAAYLSASALVHKVRRSTAEAVILLPGKSCGRDFFDEVGFRRVLEEARIPHEVIRVDPEMNLERVRETAGKLVETVRAGSA